MKQSVEHIWMAIVEPNPEGVETIKIIDIELIKDKWTRYIYSNYLEIIVPYITFFSIAKQCQSMDAYVHTITHKVTMTA